MPCPACGGDNPSEARFCMACGRPLPRPCPACGAAAPAAARFCMNCGAALATAPDIGGMTDRPTAPSRPEPPSADESFPPPDPGALYRRAFVGRAQSRRFRGLVSQRHHRFHPRPSTLNSNPLHQQAQELLPFIKGKLVRALRDVRAEVLDTLDRPLEQLFDGLGKELAADSSRPWLLTPAFLARMGIGPGALPQAPPPPVA